MNIKQVHAITKTASAIYHVLTEVFVPQMGSKENAKKCIILLSDGIMTGDNRTLNDVLNMTQMDGIVRYAIGVGTDVLGEINAKNEMIQIAGSKDQFFNVSNYGALEKIISSLEKRIIGIEATKTEIVFLLDGSGSIMQEDFERAKDFIMNVMTQCWAICLNCRFAVVQYGREIRTELFLNENNDYRIALDKVKNIKKLLKNSRTASSLFNVLKEMFVSQNGSKENAKKIIILLSDGQMAVDTRTLTEVLKMPQMEEIICYVIGVGQDILGNTQAIQEKSERRDQFIKISNYADLENILSSLVKKRSEVEEEEESRRVIHFTEGKEMLQFCLP
ncbi:hypothetical protein HF521_002828 [Silurus meridionalis]|uniref:VWFA domain-containing protein n=2 Tax=Silurus meridionalis TaxID=175797 RepID=A0A8T0B166_SILME|nr:hypothetical protein HF521_002828 [Silurus meridionalis]